MRVADWKKPKYWRCGEKGRFKSECEEKLCERRGGTGHGVDVCPSVNQVAKQKAVLAFENADLEQDALGIVQFFIGVRRRKSRGLISQSGTGLKHTGQERSTIGRCLRSTSQLVRPFASASSARRHGSGNACDRSGD